MSEILRFAEQHLSVDEKIILSCRYDGRNSYREAAGILGISEAACRKKMQRIRQKSQTHLEQISEERKGEKT